MKLRLFLAFLALSTFDQLNLVSGSHDGDAAAYQTLLYDLSNRIDSDLVDVLRSNFKLPTNILSTDATDWLIVEFTNMVHADVAESHSSNSTAEDWYNYIVNANDNVDERLRKVLGSKYDPLDVAREIRRLVNGRTIIVQYADWIYNEIMFEPKVEDIPGFRGALDRFVQKGIDAKHLKRIKSDISKMPAIYNRFVNSLSELVSMTVTLRSNYIDQANAVKKSLESLKQQGLHAVRDTVVNLKGLEDQLLQALVDLYSKVGEYNAQRITWSQSMMGIKFGKK
ncbi:uncharacterized protein LOC116345163 [Contarinia nasturtii]|uniref:uncharacterized protein LOC116345163 n=1 Tax=Contarinia nasturtii TaxID=265458 RepID=UPI0012D4035A|nr:uncharacterized protein LOC116345163 [Contarinia nasturtii]